MNRFEHGPAFHDDGTVTFRVWAPHADGATLVLRGAAHRLEPADLGWWHVRVRAADGDDYGFRLDGGPVRPDPASRRQPHGVHGSSQLVDPSAFPWSDGALRFRAEQLSRAVIYELHVGTFTRDGTLSAAIEHLPELIDIGVTHVELMPLNAFNGTAGWGYDGVGWWAVHEPYGDPATLVRFVDVAHHLGLAVVLDAVYNHLGPSGNYLPEFGPYLTDRYDTAWGPAINLDGPGSDEVRSFIIGSALAWLRDYRIDGLRLDAVHGLVDTSAVHILAQLSEAVAALSRQHGRPLQLIAESDRNDPATIRPVSQQGYGMDAQWADELHHGLHTAITGESDGWYADYGGLAEVAAAYRRGFVYDGTRYSVDRGRRVGARLPDHVPGWRLVGCVQNHDQVGNRAHGDRLTALVDAARLRVAVLLLCAAPHLPMLFMGEEYGETNPFQYFTSHPEPDLARAVTEGRRREFATFGGFSGDVPDPQDAATRDRSMLDRSRRLTAGGRAWLALWRDLLRLRRDQPALHEGRRKVIDVHVADALTLAITRGHDSTADVLVVANLSAQAACLDVPAPRGGGLWDSMLDTCERRYGGPGAAIAVQTSGDRAAVEIPGVTAGLLVAG